MNNKQVKKLRQYTKEFTSNSVNDFIDTVELLPFWKRLKICLKILAKKL